MLIGDSLLLEILSDGEFHSGEELGASLSISRAAVWKQLQKIQGLGLEIQKVKGKGYCINGGLSLLNREKIIDSIELNGKNMIAKLDVETVIGSTNAQAMAYAQSNHDFPYVCTTEMQTSGKGRRGREWCSPFARNLYFSVAWQFATGASALEGLSLAIGVAVAQVLEKMGLSCIQLKWPNDILVNNQKLAGILLELTGDLSGPCQVIVGVGLNVNMPIESAESIDQPWTDIESILGVKVDRNQLLAELLTEIIHLLSEYEQKGLKAYIPEFTNRDIYIGKPVMVKMGDIVIEGVSAGVNENGALIVDTEMGRQVFNGGEITLRRLNDIRV